MSSILMTLKIFLPSAIFFEKNDISRVVAEANIGSFGILPHRRDCVATLVPGILTYESKSVGEKFVAIDEGVLIKTDLSVFISVRAAIGGKDLVQLREAVENEFINLNEQEKKVRKVMSNMESRFIRRLAEMRNE